MRAIGCVLALAMCTTPSPRAADALVDEVRGRALVEPITARCRVRVHSPLLELGGLSACGLTLEPGGRGRLDLFGPMGAQIARFNADGRGMALSISKDATHRAVRRADLWLSVATAGVVSLPQALGLLVGEIPFPSGESRVQHASAERVSLTVSGPSGIAVDVDLDPAERTIRRMQARDAQGSQLFEARYGGWSGLGATPFPREIDLVLPALELELELRIVSWSVGSPRVYDLGPPAGYVEVALTEAGRPPSPP